MIETKITPNEEGGATITGGFTASGVGFTPTVATYSLFDRGGNVINSLEDITITDFSDTYEISLNGDDLAVSDSKYTDRYLLIKIEYDTDKKQTEQLKFYINNLIGLGG